MKIEKDKSVSLAYQLEVEGAIADQAGKDQPLEYVHGTGMLLPRFEQEVEGKEPGDKFEFTLSPAEGYGEYKLEYKFDIPKEAFMSDGVLQEQFLQIGAIVPMLDGNGNVVRGTVAAVGEKSVTMDFNHPMAGKTLHFTGEVVDVREAEAGEGHHCCGKGKGHCHKHEGEEHECCHGEGHEEGKCCHEGGKECDCDGDCDCKK